MIKTQPATDHVRIEDGICWAKYQYDGTLIAHGTDTFTRPSDDQLTAWAEIARNASAPTVKTIATRKPVRNANGYCNRCESYCYGDCRS